MSVGGSSTSIKRFSLFFLLNLGLIVLVGCSHYHWGPTAQYAPFQSVYIKPVANKAYIPQAQALLSNELAHELQQSTLATYASQEAADVTLEVTLVDYARSMAGTHSEDTFLAHSFIVTLTAEVTLIDNPTGKKLVDKRRVKADITALTDGGLQTIEYQDMPTLTRKMARRIKDLVTFAW